MNIKHTLLTAALALMLPLAGVKAQPWTTNNLPSGLIAWWPAESNALDIVGAHHGSPAGDTTFVPARAGNGFVFDGTNDSVSIPHAGALNVPATGFTVEFWMKAGKDQPDTIASIVDKDHSAQDNTGWEVSCWRDTGRLSFGIGDGTSFPLCTNLTDVLDNQFHHVAFAWDKTNWLIYVNGVLENSLPRPVVANNTRPLRFGYHWGDTAGTPMRFFKGVLDEVRVYHRALTAAEVARLALNLPGASGVWGLKTHDPVSQAPTTLFHFKEVPPGSGAVEIGSVTLGGNEIEADALAMSPSGALYAFWTASDGSVLISINPTNAVATVVGSLLSSRSVRGAFFTLSGRLIAFDTVGELIEVNPATGEVVGTPVSVPNGNPGGWSNGGDITQAPDGSCLFADGNLVFHLDLRSGAVALQFTDTVPLADNDLPYCAGLTCSPLAVPEETIFAYEVSDDDSVYSYLPAAGFTRTLLINDVVPAYNAGRGDLAALPAARVESVSISRSGTNVTLSTVCRGGVWAEVVFTDDLGAPNWQVVPGTAGWVPYTAGTIATPKTWTHLPATASQRFFRVATR